MAGLSEMLQYAQTIDQRKRGMGDAIGKFGAAVGEGVVGYQETKKGNEDRALDRAIKMIELRNKIDQTEMNRRLNAELDTIFDAQATKARKAVFDNVPAGTHGVTDNTTQSKLGSMLSAVDDLAKRGLVAEISSTDGKVSRSVKTATPRFGSTGHLLSPSQVDVLLDANSTADDISREFPTGVSAADIRIALQSQKEAAIQGRHSDKLAEARKGKAAKVASETQDKLNVLDEAKGIFDKYRKIHKDLVGRGLAGDPVTAATVGLYAKGSGGKSGTSDVKAYQDMVNASVTKFRKFMGDSGAPSNFDVERFKGMFPSLGEGVEVADEKSAIIENMFDLARRGEVATLTAYMSELGLYPDGIDVKTKTGGGGSGKVRMKSPDGKLYDIDASEMPEALQNGWTRG